ncbi:DUF3558 domain-containing protein [Actinomycetospora aeridis]|uniref:DUF3558 domain-containing protein n=1 Tax=Actinomycetospora aeridis TaxID=3129231 RepID=A0ABU8N8R7_9PSEU
MSRLLVAVLLLAVVAACSQPSPPAAPDPRAGAPVPPGGRDVTVVASDPCRALDDAVSESGFSSPGEQRTVASGDRSCRWTAPDDSQFASAIIFSGRDVLADAYRLRRFAIFEPSAVAGFPAVREQASAESASCTITVGIQEDQGFIVTLDDQAAASGGLSSQPCARAQEVAERIVAALPPLPGK